MGRVIVRNVIKRRPGYLYYLDGKGNVCEAKMSRGGKRKKKKAAKRKPAKRRVAKRKPAKRKKPAKRRKRR